MKRASSLRSIASKCMATSLVILMWAGVSGCGQSQDAKPKPKAFSGGAQTRVNFTDPEYEQWFKGFYHHPSPDRVAEGFLYAFRSDRMSDERGRLPQLIFYGRVFHRYPEQIRPWLMSHYKKFQGDDLKYFLSMIWFADCPESRSALKDLKPKLDEVEQYYVQKLLTHSPKSILEMPLGPFTIEMLMAAFGATGDAVYVERVVDALAMDHPKPPPDFHPSPGQVSMIKAREFSVSVAVWFLMDWARDDESLRNLLEAEVPKRKGIVQERLTQILADLEKESLKESFKH